MNHHDDVLLFLPALTALFPGLTDLPSVTCHVFLGEIPCTTLFGLKFSKNKFRMSQRGTSTPCQRSSFVVELKCKRDCDSPGPVNRQASGVSLDVCQVIF
jgi:hypothetical protein